LDIARRGSGSMMALARYGINTLQRDAMLLKMQ
jgi:hypothetical protein